MPKISKGQAGYTYHPDTDYRCVECVMIKDIRKGVFGCAWIGPTDPISAQAGSCIYFAHGPHDAEKKPDIPWLNLFTKQQLDYEENPAGFSCKRCEHMALISHDCSEVDRKSEGDTPGEINPYACCDVWEKDKERGSMTRKQLDNLVTSIDKARKVA